MGATRARNALTRAEFGDYLNGCKTACGIVLHRVRRLKSPRARQSRGPASFCYLRADDSHHARILRDAGRALTGSPDPLTAESECVARTP